MQPRFFPAVALVFILSSALLGQTSPDATVRAFYAYNNARSSTFNRRHIESRKQWYTAELYAAFLAQLAEDDAYLKKNPSDKPYFGDGLTFRPLDEPCESNGKSYKRVQRISKSTTVRSRATVDVTFAYPSACREPGEPIVYHVELKKVGAKWLIDDWKYDEGPSLVTDMKANNY